MSRVQPRSDGLNLPARPPPPSPPPPPEKQKLLNFKWSENMIVHHVWLHLRFLESFGGAVEGSQDPELMRRSSSARAMESENLPPPPVTRRQCSDQFSRGEQLDPSVPCHRANALGVTCTTHSFWP